MASMLKKIPLPLILLALCIAITHYLSLQYAWYVKNPWLDIVMHFVTGGAISYAFFWYLYRFNASYLARPFLSVIIPTLIIGLGWEWFEYYYDITGWPIDTFNYKFDTAKDLVMDTLGGITMLFILRKK